MSASEDEAMAPTKAIRRSRWGMAIPRPAEDKKNNKTIKQKCFGRNMSVKIIIIIQKKIVGERETK